MLQLTHMPAQAVEILCSKKPKSAPEIQFEKDGGAFTISSEGNLGNISLNDLFDQFSRGIGVKSNQPVLLCLFPQTHPNTIELFELLGIDNAVINTFFNERQIQIRRTKLVRSDSEMIACVASTYPSIGYIASNSANSHSLRCF